jgi:phage shock protein PspC (stress-responsive transcriptional regulator)
MPRRLTRDRKRAALGGVASGFARYLEVDPVLVRFAFVILTFFHGLGLLLYLVGWAVIPPDDVAHPGTPGPVLEVPPPIPDTARSTEPPLDGPDRGRRLVGWGLVMFGGLLLLHNLDWIRWPHWANLRTLWPLALVGMGMALLRRSFEREAA